MIFATLEALKDHVRAPSDLDDVDLQEKLLQASAIVADYILLKNTPENWFISGVPVNVPPVLRAATLLIAGNLYANREGLDGEVITPAVENLLRRWRPYVGLYNGGGLSGGIA